MRTRATWLHSPISWRSRPAPDETTVPGAVRRHQARAVSLTPVPVSGGWGVALASGF